MLDVGCFVKSETDESLQWAPSGGQFPATDLTVADLLLLTVDGVLFGAEI